MHEVNWENFSSWMSQSEINHVAVNQALDKIKLNNQEEVNETLFESVCSVQAGTDLFQSFQDFCHLFQILDDLYRSCHNFIKFNSCV